MNTKLPRTPFATSLSGSAKETELRIKSILHGPKKRPPFWMMALTALTILLCGSLVSCQPEQEMILYYDPSNLTQSMVDQMYQEVAEQSGLDLESGTVEKTLMSAKTIGDHVLTSAYIHDDYPRYTFVLGVSALGESELIGPAFTANNSGGIPRVHNFEKDGKDYLLYTANGSGQGYSHGEAGLVTLDGDQLTWLWPVEGDVRDENSAAHHNYYTFWENQKALMSPGGVDIFVENHPSNPYSNDPPQWTPDHNEQFYPVPEDELPIGVMYQARVWVEEYTRDDESLWQGCGSAVWTILGLKPHENNFSGQLEQEQAYSLTIQSDVDYRQIHTFTMMFDREAGTMRRYQGLYGVEGVKELTRLAYADALQELLDHGRLPTGEPVDLDHTSASFAVRDVDLDGKHELLLQCVEDGGTTGGQGFVFGYSETTGKLLVQLKDTPLPTFYANATAAALWPDDPGQDGPDRGGPLWPYSIYKHQPSTDNYILVGSVDAYHKELAEENGWDDYPEEADTSKTGTVYYIQEGPRTDFNYDHPVDLRELSAWHDKHIRAAAALSISYQKVTQANIDALRASS